VSSVIRDVRGGTTDEPGAPSSVTPTTPGPARGYSGASPAVPRDPRLLAAEKAEYEARAAADEAAAAKAAADDAVARAAAAKAAADKSKAELEAAREEARAKARAAALQVRMEQEQQLSEAEAVRAQARAVRDQRLGTVHTVATEVEPEVVTVVRRSTDKFAGAFGLFLLRLLLAAFIGIVGWQTMVDRPAVSDALVTVGLPESVVDRLGPVVGVGLIVVAVFLLVGLGTRIVAGLVLIATAVFLAFFRFGPFSPFIEGQFGFYGDRELFIAIIALLFVLVGAGGWSLDARIRHSREAGREEE